MGSARRLDRGATSGPFHRSTVSKSGRVSLSWNDGKRRHGLSRFEKGTIVHLKQPLSGGWLTLDRPLKRVDCGLSLRPQSKLGNLKKADARGCDPVFSMCKCSERRL